MSVWETYSFLQFSVGEVSQLIRNNEFPEFKLDHLSNKFNGNEYARSFDKKDVLGITHRILNKSNLVRAFIDPVAYTEYYLQDLCEIVYRDYPIKLLGKDPQNNQAEQKDSQIKLLSLIVKFSDKKEMMDAIIEEKIRNIFYKNPVEFYTKDRANIGLGTYFKDNHANTIKRLAEIIARRNAYIHNDGRVDSKYLREVEGTAYRFNEIAKIDEEYVRENIYILRGFAAVVTRLVIQNVYGVECINKLINENSYAFNRKYNR